MTDSSSHMRMVTVSAPTNIAVIKYWGKANVEFNTPINSSLSVTLDQADLRAVTTAAASKQFTSDRLWLNGVEQDVTTSKRFRACVDGVKQLATDIVDDAGNILISKQDWTSIHVHVSSYNTFPTAAGLASSAAGYAALVAALAELMHAEEQFPGQLSTLARQGSGSACRSLYGGFVAWWKGSPDTKDWLDSKAEQIVPETHWPELRALILVVSDQKKDTSSTAGMSTSVATSPLLSYRAQSVVPTRMEQMVDACRNKDFDNFAKLTMQDSNQFHATCLDTYPPIFYMNDVSKKIIRLVTIYNEWAGHIRAAYTFDAGPNAVLYVLDEHVVELGTLMLHFFPPFGQAGFVNNSEFHAKLQDHQLDQTLLRTCKERLGASSSAPVAGEVKKLYYTRPGPGPQVLSNESNLDATTGLNSYQAEM